MEYHASPPRPGMDRMIRRRHIVYATMFAIPLALQSRVLYIQSMQQKHGLSALDRQVVEHRRRAFRAALELGGNTQSSWAVRHGLNDTSISNVLSGRRQSPHILGLIYKEIDRARKIAPTYMAEAL